MNFKKFIYNLFFGKKKKSGRQKSTQKKSAESNSSTSKTKRTTKTQKVKGCYDTSLLRQQVSETEYISNLRIGRSWILPQMVEMGFRKGKFDIATYEVAIKSKYNGNVSGRRMIWDLLKRNYKVVADSNGTSIRTKWWTKELLIKILDWDFALTGKCRKGLDRKECIKILNTIEDISDPKEIYATIQRYDGCRMRKRISGGVVPDGFIDAYMGDGAYNAMMTMVKVLDIRIEGIDGCLLSREECITEIENQTAALNGRQLVEYCKDTFFDSGAFEYKKYIKKK